MPSCSDEKRPLSAARARAGSVVRGRSTTASEPALRGSIEAQWGAVPIFRSLVNGLRMVNSDTKVRQRLSMYSRPREMLPLCG